MKLLLLSNKLLIILLVTLTTNGLFSFSVRTESTNDAQNQQQKLAQNDDDKLDFSGDGRPGKRVGGGSRSFCSSTEIPLTAVVPASNVGATVSDRPNFWFYVPYGSQQATTGEFVLQDRQENDVYRQTFDLPQTPGLVSLKLPKTAPSLEVGRPYRWYFKLYCGDSASATANFVEGWITRISLVSNLATESEQGKNPTYQEYGSNSIWFDALDNLAQLRLEKDNPRLEQDWNQLLSAKGVNLRKLTQIPLVGSVNAAPNSK